MAVQMLPASAMSEYSKYGDGAVAMPGGIATGSHPIMLEVAPPQQPAAEEEKNDLQQHWPRRAQRRRKARAPSNRRATMWTFRRARRRRRRIPPIAGCVFKLPGPWPGLWVLLGIAASSTSDKKYK